MNGTKRWLVEITASLYILLFTYAALSKLIGFEKFVVQLNQSVILTSVAGFVAWAVPVSELIISALLFMSKTRLWGLYSAFMLMALFSVYIVAITQFTENTPCSCGGILEAMTWNQHLVFNLAFLIAAGFSIFWYEENRASAQRLEQEILSK